MLLLELERSIMPNFGELEFGISKSLSNYAVGQLTKSFSRKKILVFIVLVFLG